MRPRRITRHQRPCAESNRVLGLRSASADLRQGQWYLRDSVPRAICPRRVSLRMRAVSAVTCARRPSRHHPWSASSLGCRTGTAPVEDWVTASRVRLLPHDTVVGVTGVEPATSRTQSACTTTVRHPGGPGRARTDSSWASTRRATCCASGPWSPLSESNRLLRITKAAPHHVGVGDVA